MVALKIKQIEINLGKSLFQWYDLRDRVRFRRCSFRQRIRYFWDFFFLKKKFSCTHYFFVETIPVQSSKISTYLGFPSLFKITITSNIQRFRSSRPIFLNHRINISRVTSNSFNSKQKIICASKQTQPYFGRRVL